MHVHTHMQTYMHAHTCMHTYIHAHTRMHTYMHAHTHACVGGARTVDMGADMGPGMGVDMHVLMDAHINTGNGDSVSLSCISARLGGGGSWA